MGRRTMTVFGLLLGGAALVLTGCGGGGGGDSAPAEAAPAAESAAAEAPAETAAPAGDGAVPSGSATIAGTITYEGDVPNLKPVSMSADPACEQMHTESVPSEVLVLGGDAKTLGNVFVRVTSGLADQAWAVPGEPVIIDQKGCLYKPHVVGVVANQDVKFLNSDGILHNVHALPKVNREFNMAMPAERTEAIETFSKTEDMFRVKCDVHPWMNAYVRVMDHPFFSTTMEDGQFSISGLEPGTYEIEAWHEKLGTQTATVTVGDGETATTDLTFTR